MAEVTRINLRLKKVCGEISKHSDAISICICPNCSTTGESTSQLLETYYEPLDALGCDTDQCERVFDVEKSVLPKLESASRKYGVSPFDIEEGLLRRYGIGVSPKLTKDENTFAISRNNPIPWSCFITMAVEYVKVPGMNKIFEETTKEPENIPNHLRDMTFYNDMLRHAFRSNVLIEVLSLMDEIIGFHKNPISEPTNSLFEKFRAKFDPKEWVRYGENTEYIRSMTCRLDDFVRSVYDENGNALFSFLEWMFASIKQYYTDLHLADKELWDRGRGENYTYAHHLRKYSEMNRLAVQIQNRALIRIWQQLRCTATDLAQMVETTLEK